MLKLLIEATEMPLEVAAREALWQPAHFEPYTVGRQRVDTRL